MLYCAEKGEAAIVSDQHLVTVYRSQGLLAAEVIKAKLTAAGVPALLRYESAGPVLGLTVDGLGLVEVQVPEAWADDALALIAEDSDDPADQDWQGEPDEEA